MNNAKYDKVRPNSINNTGKNPSYIPCKPLATKKETAVNEVPPLCESRSKLADYTSPTATPSLVPTTNE